MEKYLVFRLEKPLYENEHPKDRDVVIPCFELVKEFEVSAVQGRPAAEHFAFNYSKDHGLRTVVIKGFVFGQFRGFSLRGYLDVVTYNFMDKLEERFFDEFNNPEAYSLHGKPGFELEEHFARIAAKICLEIAEKAYNQGRSDEGLYFLLVIFHIFSTGILVWAIWRN